MFTAGSITSQSFPDFLNLSESCREKAVFVQRHNTSLHSKFRQTALKLTPKGLDYTQIGTLRELCITDLWFWEVLGQSQSWLRTMQTDLWKLYTTIPASLNSWPPVQKSKSCACACVIVFLKSKQTISDFSFVVIDSINHSVVHNHR